MCCCLLLSCHVIIFGAPGHVLVQPAPFCPRVPLKFGGQTQLIPRICHVACGGELYSEGCAWERCQPLVREQPGDAADRGPAAVPRWRAAVQLASGTAPLGVLGVAITLWRCLSSDAGLWAHASPRLRKALAQQERRSLGGEPHHHGLGCTVGRPPPARFGAPGLLPAVAADPASCGPALEPSMSS